MTSAYDSAVRIAVVIPCYRVTDHVRGVIDAIGPEVWRVYAIDDKCPDGSGDCIIRHCTDPRVVVLRHDVNLGVGGAVMTGYRRALADGATVIVKLDGDGQMDPALVPRFVAPILEGEADYTKGNRFFDLERTRSMPAVRLFGNAVLSFMTKISSGYWDLFDPSNGYTAIHADVARRLPFHKLSTRYFFESDMLFRLNTLRAVVVDVPMDAAYRGEVSSLKVSSIVDEFLYKHFRNFGKRLFYNYYLRDLSIASLQLPIGLLLLAFGVTFGLIRWMAAAKVGAVTPAGTVMLSALPILTGLQLVLAFFAFDISAVPRKAWHRRNVAFTGAVSGVQMPDTALSVSAPPVPRPQVVPPHARSMPHS